MRYQYHEEISSNRWLNFMSLLDEYLFILKRPLDPPARSEGPYFVQLRWVKALFSNKYLLNSMLLHSNLSIFCKSAIEGNCNWFLPYKYTLTCMFIRFLASIIVLAKLVVHKRPPYSIWGEWRPCICTTFSNSLTLASFCDFTSGQTHGNFLTWAREVSS